ncbi:MAG: DUF898 family protein [Cucumibacter sp.]
MNELAAPAPPIAGRFTGTRTRLFSVLLRGYLLLVPTLGIYRFWLITQKRRFFWSHTRLGGDALEYAGTATEILFGFLIAVAIFVPFYFAFFFFGTQTPTIAAIGTFAALLALFLLSGFALFRSRRYRLTRTLWRGIRFNQSGSAWKYAFMRFGWYLLTGVTLGLAYPFMAASLFRYRYDNSWWGDRRLKFLGSWRDIAGPFYTMWGLVAALLAAVVWSLFSAGYAAGLTVLLGSLLLAVVALLAFPYITARERTRFTSKLTMGDAAIGLRIRARWLIGMYLVYALVLVAATIGIFVLVSYLISGTVAFTGNFDSLAAIQRILEQSSWLTIAVFGAGYLGVVGILALIGELFLGFTFWRIVVANLTIANPASLDAVRAFGKEAPALGEGLADALTSGGY